MGIDYKGLISLEFSKILLFPCSHDFSLCEAILSPKEPSMIDFSLVKASLIRYCSLAADAVTTAATAFTIACRLVAFSVGLFIYLVTLINHVHTS